MFGLAESHRDNPGGRPRGNRTRPRPWWLALRVCTAGCVLALPTLPAAADSADSVRDAQWPLEAVDAQGAWQVSKGDGVTVALIDSGVESTHPDLRGQVAGGGDLAGGGSGDGTHDAKADRGHGTQVASLVAGTGRNYKQHGLLGLAPEARILSFGVYRDGRAEPAAMAEAIRAAVDEGAQVILAPAGGTHAGPHVVSAVRHALSRDTVVVTGVGGEPGRAAQELSGVSGVVAVTAIDRQGKVWPEDVDHAVLAAPGVEVLAASSDGSYWTGDDTGFAAAWVAGSAALLRAANPEWSAAQTIQKLIDTARAEQSGCADACGYGLVSPARALTDTTPPDAESNPLLSSTSRQEGAPVENPIGEAAWGPILVFIVTSLAALLLYVAITAGFIRRQGNRTNHAGG